MKYRIADITYTICAITAIASGNTVPIVGDVTASQRADGSRLVDIHYNMADADGDACTVSVSVSDDGGSTWNVPASSFSGDVGFGTTAGSGKHIVWNSMADLPGAVGSNYRVKVTANDNYDLPGPDITWVAINDPGVPGHKAFNGYMSKYETTNARYCEYLNQALASNDIVVVAGYYVRGASGTNPGTDFIDQDYYNLFGTGSTGDGAVNGGAARINWTGSAFTVDNGFENHPVTYVSWYGATAFADYYGWRLPTEWEWQAVADYNGSYTYGCGATIINSIANYAGSSHPDGTTRAGIFGTYGYGMGDLAGNVWEWTSSCSYADCRDSIRVLKGGCWLNYENYCAVNIRFSRYPHTMYYYLGFRVCR